MKAHIFVIISVFWSCDPLRFHSASLLKVFTVLRLYSVICFRTLVLSHSFYMLFPVGLVLTLKGANAD